MGASNLFLKISDRVFWFIGIRRRCDVLLGISWLLTYGMSYFLSQIIFRFFWTIFSWSWCEEFLCLRESDTHGMRNIFIKISLRFFRIVDELDLVKDPANVYKLTGPVLVKQDLDDAKM